MTPLQATWRLLQGDMAGHLHIEHKMGIRVNGRDFQQNRPSWFTSTEFYRTGCGRVTMVRTITEGFTRCACTDSKHWYCKCKSLSTDRDRAGRNVLAPMLDCTDATIYVLQTEDVTWQSTEHAPPLGQAFQSRGMVTKVIPGRFDKLWKNGSRVSGETKIITQVVLIYIVSRFETADSSSSGGSKLKTGVVLTSDHKLSTLNDSLCPHKILIIRLATVIHMSQ